LDTGPLTQLAEVGLEVVGDDATHIIFILDRSGSMAGKQDDVIGGVNSFVARQRVGEGATGVSLVRFDNVAELVWNDLDVHKTPELTSADYWPRGGTALLDAMGMTVSAVKANPAHRYVVITHTDGMENASREWTKEKVRDLVAAREAEGNWTFTFFGEGIDAWGEGGQYGHSAGNTMSYASADRSRVYDSTAKVARMMREKKVASTRFFAEAARAASERPDMSDEEIEEILKREEETPTTPR
jgi:hypothetical protein